MATSVQLPSIDFNRFDCLKGIDSSLLLDIATGLPNR